MIYATIALSAISVFAILEDEAEQGKTKSIIWITIVLCLFAGIRDVSMGTDLQNYLDKYNTFVNRHSYVEIITLYLNGKIKDGLFYVLMKTFSDCGLSYQIFIATLTAIYVIQVGRLIARYSTNTCLSYMMFFSLSWFLFVLTGLRQSVAMAVCIMALLEMLENKKSIKAFLLILVSGLFHSSAWVFFIAYVVSRIDYKITLKIFMTVALLAVILSIVGEKYFRRIIMAIAWNEALATYADTKISLNWSGFIIQFAIAAVSFRTYNQTVEKYPYSSLLYSIMAIGVFCQAFSSVIAEMFRISMYFSIAAICVFPLSISSITDDDTKNFMYIASYLVFLVYFFYAGIYSNYVIIFN